MNVQEYRFDYLRFAAPLGYIPALLELMKRKREMDTDGYCDALEFLADEFNVLDDVTVRRVTEIRKMAQRRREKGLQRGNLF